MLNINSKYQATSKENLVTTTKCVHPESQRHIKYNNTISGRECGVDRLKREVKEKATAVKEWKKAKIEWNKIPWVS